jgi:hypothetical protein
MIESAISNSTFPPSACFLLVNRIVSQGEKFLHDGLGLASDGIMIHPIRYVLFAILDQLRCVLG